MDHCRHARHRQWEGGFLTSPSHPSSFLESGDFVAARIKSIDPDGRDMTEFAALYSPAKGGCYGPRITPCAPKILIYSTFLYIRAL